MADFKKRLSSKKLEKKINPLEIYDTLDRRSETGPLRPVQIKILKKWFEEFKEKRDIILKLHTGQGKTLIGLLILQSRINQDKGPALYLCPNKHLAMQTAEQAKKFGIPFQLLEDDIPPDFTEKKKILISHVQKLFNGLTKFGLNNKSIHVSSIVLDDSHACIDAIKNSFTITLSHHDDPYNDLVELFEDDLKSQGLGSYTEIRQNESDALLAVPYWAWNEKIERVLEILSNARESMSIKFQWPLLKDHFKKCQCYITGRKIEITPLFNPIDQFGSFSKSSQRILMSATTLDDSFFVKGLGLSVEAIKNPLKDEEETWSGEKMILIPNLIDENLDRIRVINDLIRPNPKRNVGLVVLVSSFSATEIYENQECTVATAESIQVLVDKLKSHHFDTPVVIVNRYDGIDLPDDACRILVLDGKPFAESLSDRYEEQCRLNSDLINIRIAQKIEQGLGRSVRGEKDYSVIILLGSELVNFVRASHYQKYFSEQTRKQIQIGLEVAAIAKEDLSSDPDHLKAFYTVIGQCVSDNRDENWKEFYIEKMNEVTSSEVVPKVVDILEMERQAEYYFFLGDYQRARQVIQDLIDNFPNNESDKGWYLQTIARILYESSITDSNTFQIAAFKKNYSLLKPKHGISYPQIAFIAGGRIQNIKKYFEAFATHSDLQLHVEALLSNLSFGTLSEKFESALDELGKLLGFSTQRPDKENKRGPDNLWCVGKNEFILFECKNEVKESRTEISKLETGQMNNSSGWFENHYPGSEVKRIMIIPTKNVSAAAAFNVDVQIMRKGKLKLLKENIRAFIRELVKFDIHNISDEQIQSFLNTHHLDVPSLRVDYSEQPYQQL